MRVDRRRLALIERGLATPWTKFRRADGAAVLVPDRMAVNAFLHALGGQPLGMGDAVEAFLATWDADERAPDVEVLVVDVARKQAGVHNAAPAQRTAPREASTSGGDEMEDEPQSGIAELLAEEEAMIRAAKSQEWLAAHYPEPAM